MNILVGLGIAFVAFAMFKFARSLWANDLSKHEDAPDDYARGTDGGGN